MLLKFSELFSYTFITRSLFAGILIALCASLLGVSLVLKRYSMIGDGLSHVGFGALAVAAAMNAATAAAAMSRLNMSDSPFRPSYAPGAAYASFFNRPSQVFLPTTPSAARPSFPWAAFTAQAVLGPNSPSAWIVFPSAPLQPPAARRRWTVTTCAPALPVWRVFTLTVTAEPVFSAGAAAAAV